MLVVSLPLILLLTDTLQEGKPVSIQPELPEIGGSSENDNPTPVIPIVIPDDEPEFLPESELKNGRYSSLDMEMLSMFRERVSLFYENKQISNMRKVAKSNNEEGREILGSRFRELQMLYKSELGEDIEQENKALLKSIEKIRKKGKVNNEAEFRLIESRHHELFAEHGNSSEVIELDRLMKTYN